MTIDGESAARSVASPQLGGREGADRAGRVPTDEGARLDRGGNDRAGADDGVLADLDAREHDRPAALLERCGRRAQIDLRLARPGDPVQQSPLGPAIFGKSATMPGRIWLRLSTPGTPT